MNAPMTSHVRAFPARRAPTAVLAVFRYILIVGILAGAAFDAQCAPVPMDLEWRSLDGSATWQALPTGELVVIPRNPAGAEVRITVDPHAMPDDAVLVIRNPGLERFRWRSSGSGEIRQAHLMQTSQANWSGHNRIAIDVAALPRRGDSVFLEVEPQASVPGPLQFIVMSASDFRAEDARSLAFSSACFGIMFAMAVMALLFSALLRDLAYLLYAGYVLTYAFIFAIQTGYVAAPLGWNVVADAPRAFGAPATMASTVLAITFLSYFAGLRRYAPFGRIMLAIFGGTIVAAGVLRYLPLPAARALSQAAINPLLMLGGPLLLVIAVYAWARGSRYAGFFAMGWAPLLSITSISSAQFLGSLPEWTWTPDAALAAGAFEALLVSAGLADRTAHIRRDRDAAVELAETDPLTGLYNRRALEDRLSAALTQATTDGRPLSVLFMDLDRFKELNDTLGHAAGDDALKLLGDQLRIAFRRGDIVGRYGGEEFLAVLPDCERVQAMTIAERLRQRFAEESRVPPFEQGLTLSIGIAEWQLDESADDLMARADGAMYRAKRRGRNRTELARAGNVMDSGSFEAF